MSMKLFAATLMASAMLAAPAMAQSDTAPGKPMATSPATTMTSPTKSTQKTGEWRSSKLIGLNVYNGNNEKIGDINELISSQDGKIDTVVVGVGGFLGMGEHNVGIAWDQVKFVKEPAKTASSTSTTPATSTTGSASTASATTVRDYPDHAMVNMTKDQLKALPAFTYASDKK